MQAAQQIGPVPNAALSSCCSTMSNGNNMVSWTSRTQYCNDKE